MKHHPFIIISLGVNNNGTVNFTNNIKLHTVFNKHVQHASIPTSSMRDWVM